MCKKKKCNAISNKLSYSFDGKKKNKHTKRRVESVEIRKLHSCWSVVLLDGNVHSFIEKPRQFKCVCSKGGAQIHFAFVRQLFSLRFSVSICTDHDEAAATLLQL